MKMTFEEIRAELLGIYPVIRDLDETGAMLEPDPTLEKAFYKLDRLAAMDIQQNELEKIYASSELKKLLPAVSRLRNGYGLYLEIKQAHTVLAASDPWKTLREFPFYRNYIQLAEMEVSGANLKKGNTIVFLGSGPLPLSLVVLCSQYKMTGIGLEQDASLVDLSRKLIDQLGLSGQISIKKWNHFSLPLKEQCQLLMIAAMARPKEEIFRQVSRCLPTGSLLSYRTYEKGLRRLLDQDSNFKLPSGFTQYRSVQPQPPVNNSVMIVKTKNGKLSR